MRVDSRTAVYPSLRTPASEDTPTRLRRGWFRVGGNVIALGTTSLLTDISSEMVNAILPIYLVFHLRFTPLQFGIFNGIYAGIAGIARIWGALIADRRHRYKEVAGVGYVTSTLCKLGLIAAGTAAIPTSGILFLDRVGKGIRTAPRDALISLSVVSARLGEAFGVHRAMDTTGALIGPVVAFWILDTVPRAYDAVFVVSFLFGVLGIGVLVIFVRNRTPAAGPRYRPHVALRAALGLFREARVRAVLIAAVMLGLFTMGDAFVYLTFQHTTSFTTKFFPLLYVGTALIYLLLAVPMGRLADRIGRGRVFLGGQLFLVGAYALLLLQNPGPAALDRHPRDARYVLRDHRRCAHGPGERDPPRGPAHERDRAAHHRDRGRAADRLDRVRRAVGLDRPRTGRAGVHHRPRGHDRAVDGAARGQPGSRDMTTVEPMVKPSGATKPAHVVAVASGSPAARAGVAVGDELLAINGEAVRDVIRYQVQADEPTVELELRRGGLEQICIVEKAAGEPLGLELDAAVFDRVRTCDNHCPFCFIYQLPKGMRKSLYLKDDDYRLSFLYGNFTTLTRFTEADLERVITERLGPLYVSIHATDPDVRTKLLRNRRGATSLRWLAELLAAGIEVHGQVVVCPGVNDASVLDDTMLGILDRYPQLATVGVVPLGVSAHSNEAEMRPHTTAEAAAVVECVERWQVRFEAALGHRLVYLADEYYLLAGRPFPDAAAYDGFPQHENGVGMARTFEAEVTRALAGDDSEGTRPKAGFFAWVDGVRPDGYRVPALRDADVPVTFRAKPAERAERAERAAAPITILTGEYGAAVLEPLVPALTAHAQVPVRVHPVDNQFFGGNIAVTGLLTGVDVAAALADVPVGDRVLLPDVVISQGRFLDGSTLEDLPRTVDLVPTDGASLVAALR